MIDWVEQFSDIISNNLRHSSEEHVSIEIWILIFVLTIFLKVDRITGLRKFKDFLRLRTLPRSLCGETTTNSVDCSSSSVHGTRITTRPIRLRWKTQLWIDLYLVQFRIWWNYWTPSRIRHSTTRQNIPQSGVVVARRRDEWCSIRNLKNNDSDKSVLLVKIVWINSSWTLVNRIRE